MKIYITKNGKEIVKLTDFYQDHVDTVKSLFGILPKDITLEETRVERLSNI